MTNTTNTNTAGNTVETTKKEGGLGTWIFWIIVAVVIWNIISGSHSIEGMWQVESMGMGNEYVNVSSQEIIHFSFDDNGSGYIAGDGQGVGFEYSYDDGSLIMVAEGESSYAHCEISGKRMTMEINGTIINLKRV